MNEVEPHYWHKITVRRMTHCDAEVMVLVPASMKTSESIANLAAAVADGTAAWDNDVIEHRCITLNRAETATEVPTQRIGS